MSDSDPIRLYTYLFEELNKKNIAFVEVMEPGEGFAGPSAEFHPKPEDQVKEPLYKVLRKSFKGCYISNNHFNFDSAQAVISNGDADAVTFGRLFIANPDLVDRFKNNWSLNEERPENYYFGGEKGYIDYPYYNAKI